MERDVELLDRYDKIVGKKGMIDFVLTQFGTQSKLTVETGV